VTFRFPNVYLAPELFLRMVLVLCFLSQSVLAKKEFSIEGSFESYCIECHGMKGKVKGEVNLISFTEGKRPKRRSGTAADDNGSDRLW
jgi:hypothetical protein